MISSWLLSILWRFGQVPSSHVQMFTVLAYFWINVIFNARNNQRKKWRKGNQRETALSTLLADSSCFSCLQFVQSMLNSSRLLFFNLLVVSIFLKIVLVTIIIKTETFIYSTTLDGSRSIIHGSRYFVLFYFCTAQLLLTVVPTASKSVIPVPGTELTFTMLSNPDREKSLPIQV